MDAFDFAFETLDGRTMKLAEFRGRPLLVANTASQCGFTPHYAGLQKLWDEYRDRGLVVIGVPSNDFGRQEPGDAAQIRALCDSYDVTFPLTRKEQVIGAAAHPLYRWIAAELGEDFAPRWNFHKYLIDRAGALAQSWPARIAPGTAEMRQAIEAALA